MKQKLLTLAWASLAAAAWSLPAHSQARPEVLVKQRQAAMTLQGKYFGPMVAMAQGKAPFNGSVVTRNSAYLDALAKMPWDGFHPSTKGEKTATLPSAYAEPGKFKEAADRFEAEVSKLSQVSRGGDENAIKAQILTVNKTCAACHEDFREKR